MSDLEPEQELTFPSSFVIHLLSNGSSV